MKYKLPPYTNINKVVLIKPGAMFDAAWKATAPEQADEGALSKSGVAKTLQELREDPDTIIRLPHLAINAGEGRPEVGFIDGRHRFKALREHGEEWIPVLVQSNVSVHKLCELPFVQKPTPELLKQLQDDEGRFAYDDDKNVRDSKKAWARSAEGAAALRDSLQRNGYGLIAGNLLGYYQRHGTLPPKHLIDEMMKQAMKKALAAGLTIEPWVFEGHGELLDGRDYQIGQARAAAMQTAIYEQIRINRKAGKKVESGQEIHTSAAESAGIRIATEANVTLDEGVSTEKPGKAKGQATPKPRVTEQVRQTSWGNRTGGDEAAVRPVSAAERYGRGPEERGGGGRGFGGP